jgi:chorismate-pyruvate lyase
MILRRLCAAVLAGANFAATISRRMEQTEQKLAVDTERSYRHRLLAGQPKLLVLAQHHDYMLRQIITTGSARGRK